MTGILIKMVVRADEDRGSDVKRCREHVMGDSSRA